VPIQALSVHLYPAKDRPLASRNPESRLDLWDAAALYRWLRVPVYVSEFGWSSDAAGVENQARWTAQAIQVTRCTPGLASLVFWGFHDHPVQLGATPDPWVRFGWLDAAGQPKPVFHEAAPALRQPLDCSAVARSAGAPVGWPDASTLPPPRLAS
jgi:hypothetical protein